MTLKDLVFGYGMSVDLKSVDDGHLVYSVTNAMREEVLEFKVPPDDQRGASFALHDTPKFFMRWIRKGLEQQELEKIRLEEGRRAWELELLQKDKENAE